MKLVKKIKWISAVTILAVGIPTVGLVFAAPTEHINTPKLATVTSQNSASSVAAQNLTQNSDLNNKKALLGSQIKTVPVANSTTTSYKHDNSHTSYSNASIAKGTLQTTTPTPQIKKSISTYNASGHSYHNGHTSSNDYMGQNYGHESEHGWGGHE
ncbi:hypothetical protein Dtox_1583 [Desulfofarcimen acetoxidans DSM 771]|jgi:hypothetical protein|uniref:Uncharacterized protein n=1 Tax=Desulfofarcimen acetoxidans (strain ATCC 49208 / DSM 771 / KCTC 5769 / VKM B-1644 / 5575) TaxID=485916 RepID=C8VW90_DESAS|nr:hypothetical protein [Desulfofarcimen acetoxidans]ACV62442.1 hypothetical protein Dtox_1583 [Desulfofarcimen acetoxidans DSM 771]